MARSEAKSRLFRLTPSSGARTLGRCLRTLTAAGRRRDVGDHMMSEGRSEAARSGHAAI